MSLQMCIPCSRGLRSCDCYHEANLNASNEELIAQAMAHPPLPRPSLEPPASDVAGWRPIAEYTGCGPVLVSTAPDSPKYLASDPVTAFMDVGGTWRCLGSIGGGAALAQAPTHFAPMPARPKVAAAPPHPASKEPGHE